MGSEDSEGQRWTGDEGGGRGEVTGVGGGIEKRLEKELEQVEYRWEANH